MDLANMLPPIPENKKHICQYYSYEIDFYRDSLFQGAQRPKQEQKMRLQQERRPVLKLSPLQLQES